jgi:hypothetical protein
VASRNLHTNLSPHGFNNRSQVPRLVELPLDQRATYPSENPASNQDRASEGRQLLPSTIPIKPGVLNSWKEIAAYLGRGVRTVQRWESELHLPIRRPRGRGRSGVLALREELDEWLRRTPLPLDGNGNRNVCRALLQIGLELQSLGERLALSADSQTRPEVEKLAHAVRTTVNELTLLENGDSNQRQPSPSPCDDDN